MNCLEGLGFPQSSPASPWKNPSFPPILFRLTQSGLIQVKEGGWQGCSEGFLEGKAKGKSQMSDRLV